MNLAGTTPWIDSGRVLPDKEADTIVPKSSTEGVKIEIDTGEVEEEEEEVVDTNVEALAEEDSTVGAPVEEVLTVEAVEVEGEGEGVGGGGLFYLPRFIKAQYPKFHLSLELVRVGDVHVRNRRA